MTLANTARIIENIAPSAKAATTTTSVDVALISVPAHVYAVLICAEGAVTVTLDDDSTAKMTFDFSADGQSISFVPAPVSVKFDTNVTINVSAAVNVHVTVIYRDAS